MPPFFLSTKQDQQTAARRGRLHFAQATVSTPAFMPVGSLAAVRGLSSQALEQMGYRLILGNSYHLSLRPGCDLIARLGGLHRFMGWPHLLLTDSGGYQVFSLANRVSFYPGGVQFSSHIDGSRQRYSPAKVIEMQSQLGSNIMMPLDDCPPADADQERLRASLERTHNWADESLRRFRELQESGVIGREQKLFGIVQGGLNFDLRSSSLDLIQAIDFDGIALGGLSVGESRNEMYDLLASIAPLLDRQRPRYLMGVGAIPDLLEAVRYGIDMFDCVLPSRNGRNGQAFTSQGRLNLRNHRFQEEDCPVDPHCNCSVCSRYSRAYLRHLFLVGEMLGPILLSHHNLHFYYNFMRELRESLTAGKYLQFYEAWKKLPF